MLPSERSQDLEASLESGNKGSSSSSVAISLPGSSDVGVGSTASTADLSKSGTSRTSGSSSEVEVLEGSRSMVEAIGGSESLGPDAFLRRFSFH